MIATLFLFSTALLNTRPAPVFADVRIGNSGPYRFLVDTGAQTTLIDPRLAGTLHLQPEFRVEIVTQNSKKSSPGTVARDFYIGDRALPPSEVIFFDLAEARRLDPAVRGVLGVNALAGLDFTLAPARGRFELTTGRTAGQALPFSVIEGRIAVKARMGSEILTLILDSGATHVVLFRTPAAMAKTKSLAATYGTIEGARRTLATTWTDDMFFGDMRVPTLPAAIVEQQMEGVDGLLPASVFQTVHIDRARGEVVLTR